MGGIQRPNATLNDRWGAGGDVLITGIQAVALLPVFRRRLDEALGWNTAGFVSGYRGSPLGGLDKELWRNAGHLKAAGVVFKPGLNEDLAATAVWGSQQVGLFPGARHDGVFGIWYGKGPGVDRSGDVLRHANAAGTSPRGGVLALAGDDPTAKSSTVTNGSEHAFLDAEIPVLDPFDVGEIIEFGLKGIALSRFSGLWVGMKCVAETMDGTATVNLDPAVGWTQEPHDLALPADGLHIRIPDSPLAQERRLRHFRLPAAEAFARLNGFDRLVLDGPGARFGIAVRGKAYATLRRALLDCGLDDEAAERAGLRIWKVGLAWPLDREGAMKFARGLDEILVVEDHRALIEPQLRDALYHAERHPRVVGKRDEAGRPLLSDLAELDPLDLVRVLASRLPEASRPPGMSARIAEADALACTEAAPLHQRDPFFCPGCPHNTSTKLPEGSRALAGIGCHYLVTRMPERRSEAFTQMGGEGVPWLGQMDFTSEPHVFANLGDGTYTHSGSLAVRAAVAAKANITFKILVNGAVAMTGGQVPEGEVTVGSIVSQMLAEGVARIDVVSDEPDSLRRDPLIPDEVDVHHRSDLDGVQRALRDTPGVTVLVYDQECATERRRGRKRGVVPGPARRVVINPRICEDCGECSRESNCLAVEPVETPFGRKRRIDQSACNQDLSCLQGFCPSFVTLVGATPSTAAAFPAGGAGGLAEPVGPEIVDEAWNVLLAGIGGQGVTALGAIIGTAAHLEGRPVRSVDQIGLAQKGGGVYVQIRIGRQGQAPDAISSPRIGVGQADLLIAADMMVAHGRSASPLLSRHRTEAVINADLAPTAQFVRDTETRYDQEGMLSNLRDACRGVTSLPAASRILGALGDLIYLNVFLLGVAHQRGALPLSSEAIDRAIEMNGVSIEENKAAFAMGRAAAWEGAARTPAAETLDQLVERLAVDLRSYQNAAYAARYLEIVGRVRSAERGLVGASDRLAWAAARQAHRLMAYKDEYEVARLHSDPEWLADVKKSFEGIKGTELHLAPPLFARLDARTGMPRKRVFGPWMHHAMRLLQHGKVLRGTPLDPFGWTAERRQERRVAAEFEADLTRLLGKLTPTTHGLICEWAEAAAGIRGFGPVKARNLAVAKARMQELEASLG